LKVDHDAEGRELEARVASIRTALKGVPGVQADRHVPVIANEVPHVMVTWDESARGVTAQQVTDKLLAGDLERLHVSANGTTSRTADVYFRTPTNRTVMLGSQIVVPTISVIASGATPRFRAHYEAQADYDKVSAIVYNQPTSTGIVAVLMTPAYAALAGGYDLDVPDLASVPGFDPAWALQTGVINWTASRTGGTLPLSRDAKPADGATRLTSLAQGTITPP